MKKRFSVYGMSCAACAARVEKATKALDGVTRADVNLLANAMICEYDEAKLTAEDITAAVAKSGYTAYPPDGPTAAIQAKPKGGEGDAKEALRRFLYSLVLLLPLMYISMGAMLGAPQPPIAKAQAGLIQMALSAGVLALNRKILADGLRMVVLRSPNMNTLIAIGSGVSFLYSFCLLFSIAGGGEAGHFYFETAAMIPTLISLGKYLEARAKGRATDSIRSLVNLAPKTARVFRNGEERVIPAKELVPGDECAVRQGDSVPADGVVTDGGGALDKSMLTGESVPEEIRKGDGVAGGTVCQTGYFRFRVTKVGEDTALSQIVRLVEEASASKAPVSRLADRVSAIFVPIVIAIALVTLGAWLLAGAQASEAISNAVAVLVVSCPCALGLATPTAILMGSGVGARCGILFKTAAAQETAGSITRVVFDKTGTLTAGRFSLKGLYPAKSGISEERLLAVAAAGEALSTHPLAEAVTGAAKERGIEIPEARDFELLPGRGMKATLSGEDLALGNEALLRERGVQEPVKIAGCAAIHVVLGKQYLGAIALSDMPRPEAREAIDALKAMRVKVTMLTGDGRDAANAAAGELGVEDVRAELLPGDKERIVRELRDSGERVLMAGDGVNDAPALTRADLGVAIGGGTDVAIDSADVVITGGDIRAVATVVKLGRRVMRGIRQNLFWALFYNCVGIPIAAGALIPGLGLRLDPMFAAAAMSVSSVCVVTNALRIKRFRPVGEKQQAYCPVPGVEPNDKEEKAMKKRMVIEGMMCAHCTGRVEKALNGISGVEAKVDLKGADVTVKEGVEDSALIAAVQDAGYEFVRFE